MKVNMVTPYGSKCGIASYVERMMEAWPKGGAEIRIMPLSERSINPFRFLALGLGSGKGCDVIHIQYQRGVFGMLLDVPILSYITHFPSFVLGLMRHHISGRRVVYTMHEQNDRNPWQRLMLEFIKLSGDRFLVHGRELEHILAKHGIQKSKIDVYPMPCEKAVRIDSAEAKGRLGFDGKLVVLLFGYAHRNKGYDLVVRAMADMPENAVLVIAGGPRNPDQARYYEELKALAKKCGVEGRVQFPGFVETKDVPALFSAADVGVLPYRWIQGSLALTDFMSYSVPTLTSDLVYFSAIQVEYGCISNFRKDDLADLKTKLKAILSDARLRKSLSQKSAEYVAKANWASFAEFQDSVYKKAASGMKGSK